MNNYSQGIIARTEISGGPLAPNIRGYVVFTPTMGGTNVCVYITGLPLYQPAENGNPPIGPLGFHVHEKGICDIGDIDEPFMSAGGHWNPYNQPHGNHAGDFPVLFSNNGIASMCFFTNKFSVNDVIGKAIIVHQNPDDYRTQPTGDAGKRLACGVIKGYTTQYYPQYCF